MKNKVRVADYIMQRLHDVGIEKIFQVTGRGALFLSDALAKHQGLTSVSLHHEQSCSFAAIGYAEAKDGIGAALVSTGCASTNAITGVLSAWQDGIPCVFISGQNILSETSRHTGIPLRTYGQQEADIVALVKPITKYACMLESAEEIFRVMDEAIQAANSGRKGPVWLDIPLDLQSALIELDFHSLDTVKPVFPDILSADDDQIERAFQLLRDARRPVALIGKGIRSAGAESLLRKFISRTRIPVTYSASAPDIFGAQNELSIGSVGVMGCSRAGNFAVANADLVLVLGSRLNSLTTGVDFCKFARDAKVVVVDIDRVEHTKKSVNIDVFIESDVFKFIDAISDSDLPVAPKDWVQKCIHWKTAFGRVEPCFQSSDRVDLYQLAESLSRIMPSPSTLVTDSGLAEVILPSNIWFSEGMRCLHPASQGAMGFALPAAIGAQHAQPHPVSVVVGDGSIMMNLQELESIRYQKLPIKIMVINNNVYSIIRRRQVDLFRKRTIGTDPENGVSCPDFEKVADCFGLKYMKINNIAELDGGLISMWEQNGPVLCEIMGRVDQEYIEVGMARSTIDRRFVRRPLEDQMPFLDRDFFLEEMIVKPIDQ
jgi:acetolactate synthase I/II/III large subunit